MNSTGASTGRRLTVVPAASPHDWASAAMLTHDMVSWMGAELGLDVRNAHEKLRGELSGMPSFYAFPHGMFLLAWLDGTAVGTTGVHLLTPEIAEMKRLWVAPAARGRRSRHPAPRSPRGGPAR